MATASSPSKITPPGMSPAETSTSSSSMYVRASLRTSSPSESHHGSTPGDHISLHLLGIQRSARPNSFHEYDGRLCLRVAVVQAHGASQTPRQIRYPSVQPSTASHSLSSVGFSEKH
eukprot:7685176-Pyramimonas_sp.AAC.1